MDYKVEFVGVQGNLLEGPHWLSREQKLLFNDIKEKRVHLFAPETKALETIQLDDTVGFVVPHVSGGYVAGVGNKLIHFQSDSVQDAKVIAEVEQGMNTRFNDGKCDPQGRLWAGTLSLDQTLEEPLYAGSLYMLDLDGKVTNCQSKYNIANGLAWSLDLKHFYHVDSVFPSAVYVYDFDAMAGSICNRRVLIDFSETPNARPDGMTSDTEGFLWLAVHGQSKVVRIDPNTGKVVREVHMPLQNCTSVCFGGRNLDELYVTSMKWDENDPPEAGSLMRVTGLNAQGLFSVSYPGNV